MLSLGDPEVSSKDNECNTDEGNSMAKSTNANIERSASGMLDPRNIDSAPELTGSSPAAELSVTRTSGSKGVKFAPHIPLISCEGDSRNLPCNPFPSEASLIPSEHQLAFSSTSTQSHPDIRVQPSLYNLVEFLKDPNNLPAQLTDQPDISKGESSTNKPNLQQQPSQVSLRRILAEGPPAEVDHASILRESLSLGLRRSVSQRATERVLSLVSPRKQKSARSSANNTAPTTAFAEELREQKRNDDGKYDQSYQEAETSINLGLDGSYLIHTAPTAPTLALALTSDKPLPPLPPSKQSDRQGDLRLASASPSSSQPRARGRCRNVTIRPSYEIIAPDLSRARTSSTETIKANQSSATIGVMSSSAHDTARTQRIPLVCPAWDRRVDISWSRGSDSPWDDACELSAFRVSLAQFHRESKHTQTKNDLANPLLRLPDRVRYTITKYLIPDRATMLPIKLNNGMRLYEPAWPAMYFDNLEDVLRCVRAYTSVCWAMRADVLMTILNTRVFHVVFSPFSGPLLDPLAHHWFGKYAGYIQHLILELDFTKLGFGPDPAAANLKPLVTKVVPRMEEYARAQRNRGIQQDVLLNAGVISGKLERRGATGQGGGGSLSTVHSLTVAARRYFGERPAEAGRVSQKYSPDEYLAVLGPVRVLSGKVDHMRIVGLDADSAHRVLALVWEGMTVESVRQAVADRSGTVRATCPSDFYPTLPGQASFFDEGASEDSGMGSFVRHPFAFEDGRVGFYMDEDMVQAAMSGGAHSSILRLALSPASKKVKGMPGLVSGREKGKGRDKASWETETEMEQAAEWPEEREEMEAETESCGSSTETEPFPPLPDEDVQLALLAAYNAGEAARESVERYPSSERQQGEVGEEQMPDTRSSGVTRGSSGSSRAMERVMGRLQRKISHLTPKEKS